LARAPKPREIHPRARAVSNRTKQAAPGNDPARTKSAGDTRINDRYGRRRWAKTIRWVIPGSRLFKTRLGGNPRWEENCEVSMPHHKAAPLQATGPDERLCETAVKNRR
jgi:hypothetical protein